MKDVGQISRLSSAKVKQRGSHTKDPALMECSFAPKKSKAAVAAMMNPKCAYEFISRIDDKGDFLER